MFSKKNLGIFFLLVALGAFACTRSPYAETNKAYKKNAKALAREIEKAPLEDSFPTGPWVGTTNFNLRKPSFVILHHTAQNSCDQTLRTFTLTRTSVSSHYVICINGMVYHMLNDYLRAWHAGVSKWGGATDLNSSSIGIEIDNNGKDTFSTPQVENLIALLHRLKRAHGIPTANFIGHSDIAPGRKVDPNIHFPWKRLAEEGFGYWWSDTTGLNVPQDFNAWQALRIIGYNSKDTIAVIKTFKRKFLQVEGDGDLSPSDLKVLYSLYRRYD